MPFIVITDVWMPLSVGKKVLKSRSGFSSDVRAWKISWKCLYFQQHSFSPSPFIRLLGQLVRFPCHASFPFLSFRRISSLFASPLRCPYKGVPVHLWSTMCSKKSMKRIQCISFLLAIHSLLIQNMSHVCNHSRSFHFYLEKKKNYPRKSINPLLWLRVQRATIDNW